MVREGRTMGLNILKWEREETCSSIWLLVPDSLSLMSQGSFCEHLGCHFFHWFGKDIIWKVSYLPSPVCNNSQTVPWVARHCVVACYLLPTNSKLNQHDKLAFIIAIIKYLHLFCIKLCTMVLEYPACYTWPKDINTSRPGGNKQNTKILAQMS